MSKKFYTPSSTSCWLSLPKSFGPRNVLSWYLKENCVKMAVSVSYNIVKAHFSAIECLTSEENNKSQEEEKCIFGFLRPF